MKTVSELMKQIWTYDKPELTEEHRILWEWASDIIDECEQEIKQKKTSLIIHKIIIVILTVIAIFK